MDDMEAHGLHLFPQVHDSISYEGYLLLAFYIQVVGMPFFWFLLMILFLSLCVFWWDKLTTFNQTFFTIFGYLFISTYRVDVTSCGLFFNKGEKLAPDDMTPSNVV